MQPIGKAGIGAAKERARSFGGTVLLIHTPMHDPVMSGLLRLFQLP